MKASEKTRRQVIAGIFILVAILLTGQLFRLQVLSPDYRKRAEATTVEEILLYPSRGIIRDREERILVYNRPMYDLMAVYNRINREHIDTARFCRLLNITEETFAQNLEKDWSDPRYSPAVPFVFLSRIPDTTFTRFQEHLHEFPGFFPSLRSVRAYPHSNAPHLVGTIREVNQREVERDEFYLPGDYIGDSGLELAYEDALRGSKGRRYALKDNLGREVGAFDKQPTNPPRLGAEIVTGLSLPLQTYAESLMENKVGSVVAIEPRTGEVLAMVSTPGYNPNELTIRKGRSAAYNRLLNDPGKPFFDRAVMAQYPPGSLFKPLIGLVALQEGVTSINTSVSCPGGYAFNGRILTGCHGHPTCTNISMAIQHSCNAYFVTLFRRIVDKPGFDKAGQGLEDFNEYLDLFGLGRKLGIDFPREQPGNYPSRKYYDDWYDGQRWNSIWIRSLGIGQGEILMTNLQMANMAAAIANRGFYRVPHLVKSVGGEPVDDRFQEPRYVGIDPMHFDPIIEGMELAVSSGTARMAFIPDIALCGKTGTAENPHGADHSIFFGFAPRDNPQIAVAVYVENAGFGGTFAAPIASLVMEKWLREMGEIHPTRKWIEQRMLEADLSVQP